MVAEHRQPKIILSIACPQAALVSGKKSIEQKETFCAGQELKDVQKESSS